MTRWIVLARATAWCALVLFTLQSSLLALAILWPARASEVALLGGVQVCVLGGASYVFFRAHRTLLGPSWLRACALVRCHSGWLLTAFLLGTLLQLPADGVRAVIERMTPTPEAERLAQLSMLRHDTVLRAALLFLVIGAVGPFVEELFYRGCLLRYVQRFVGRGVAWGFTSLVFTLTHASFRDWPSLLLVALALGYVRLKSASIWPSVTLHAAFNSWTLLFLVTGWEKPWIAAELIRGIA